jgi:hypothetical protein
MKFSGRRDPAVHASRHAAGCGADSLMQGTALCQRGWVSQHRERARGLRQKRRTIEGENGVNAGHIFQIRSGAKTLDLAPRASAPSANHGGDFSLYCRFAFSASDFLKRAVLL